MSANDELVERVLEVFNGGLVRIPDSSNPRGYITRYWPVKAMRAALTTAEPLIRADERERCARVAEEYYEHHASELGTRRAGNYRHAGRRIAAVILALTTEAKDG